MQLWMHVSIVILLLRQELIIVLVAVSREVGEIGLVIWVSTESIFILVWQVGCHAFILVQHVA